MSSRDGTEPAASRLHLFISTQTGSCPQKSLLLSGAAERNPSRCICVQAQVTASRDDANTMLPPSSSHAQKLSHKPLKAV